MSTHHFERSSLQQPTGSTRTHTLFHATRHQSHRPSDRDNLLCLHHAFNAQTRVKHEFFITRARPADGKASQSPHDDGENRKEQRAQRIRPRATAGMVPTAHIWYASRAGSECLRRLLPVICVIISASAQPPFRSRHTHTHTHTYTRRAAGQYALIFLNHAWLLWYRSVAFPASSPQRRQCSGVCPAHHESPSLSLFVSLFFCCGSFGQQDNTSTL